MKMEDIALFAIAGVFALAVFLTNNSLALVCFSDSFFCQKKGGNNFVLRNVLCK